MTKLFTNTLICTALSSTLIFTGCGGGGGGTRMSNEQLNTIVGAVAGGVAGHQFGKGDGRTVMTILGVALGGYLGGQLGRNMNQNDQRQVSSALDTTPNYQKVSWSNPQTNSDYGFTPVNRYEGNINGQKMQCRDYILDAKDKKTGQPMQVQGRSCRNNQGQWVAAN